MIKVSDLFRSFKGKDAVRNASFNVAAGEVIGLLGPNGAGKSTTLRAIAGLLRPDRGTIEVGGLNVSTHSVEVKRILAFVMDEPRFFENLTCWEHVIFTASMYQVADYEAKGIKLFEHFDMVEKRDAITSELSKGMKQRLAMICSLLYTPKVVLMDEPMNGLDPWGIRALNRAIKDIALSGAAVIVSSHLLPMLEETCSGLIVMNKGEIVLQGSLQEVRRNATQFSSDASLEEIFFATTRKAG